MKLLTIFLILLPLHSHTHQIQEIGTFDNRHVAEFVRSVYCEAKRVQVVYGIPLAITIGISCLETGHGSSNLCVNKCNYHGLRKYHKYLSYPNKRASFDHFGRSLTSKCYKNLQPVTIEEWKESLKCCGYYRSKTYDQKLTNLIYQFGLDKLH